MEIRKNRLYVQVGESIIGYVQPEGKFYDVDKVLKNLDSEKKLDTIAINAKYLKDALESISPCNGTRKIAEIDVYPPCHPVVIRSGWKGEPDNLKIVLPMNTRD